MNPPTTREMTVVKSGIVTKILTPLPSMRDVSAEVSLIERATKNIVCFSTQVGCAIKCKFCASGQTKEPVRNISEDDMLWLVDTAIFHAKERDRKYVISAMGEGEPAQNADAVGKVLHEFERDENMKTAVSTSAPSLRLLERLIEAVPEATKIQYSLHSATPRRREIIEGPTMEPGQVLDVLATRPNVELNIVLWQGVNTSVDEIQSLIYLLGTHYGNEPWYIKLNRANPVEGGLIPADQLTYERWMRIMKGYGYNVEYYETDGSNINAACGQLRAQHVR